MKFRLSKLGTTGSLCLLSVVVTLNRRAALGSRLFSRARRATRSRPHRIPSSTNAACIRYTIRIPALFEYIFDMRGQDQVCHLPLAHRRFTPAVVTTTHHAQDTAHQCHRILLIVIRNELVFHRRFRVKPVLSEAEGMAAAFFRISFSRTPKAWR